jgi:hypothetical protein
MYKPDKYVRLSKYTPIFFETRFPNIYTLRNFKFRHLIFVKLGSQFPTIFEAMYANFYKLWRYVPYTNNYEAKYRKSYNLWSYLTIPLQSFMLCIQSPLICEGETPNNKIFKLGAKTPKSSKIGVHNYNMWWQVQNLTLFLKLDTQNSRIREGR